MFCYGRELGEGELRLVARLSKRREVISGFSI